MVQLKKRPESESEGYTFMNFADKDVEKRVIVNKA